MARAMTHWASTRHRTATFTKNVVVFLTLAASSLAVAQAVPTIGTGEAGDSKHAYRGTSVSYGSAATALTFAPNGQPFYNPTVSHRLGLMPEWHFTDEFFVRSRFFMSQELTQSDETKYRYEVELSDLWLDAVYGGYKEKVTGIRFAGDLRFTLPTSKFSQAQTRLFTVAPGVNVSRTFKVLSGLTFVYSTRFTFRINRLPTSQNAGPSITNCTDLQLCNDLVSTGRRNAWADLLHGPTVVFAPHPKLSFSATFLMQRGFLPELAPVTDPSLANVDAIANPSGPNSRDATAFVVGINYQPFDVVGFSLGSFTFSNQLRADGTYEFPLFNRNTVVSLDATFDLEAVISAVTPKEQK
jgi:hypothetical protein